MECMPVRLIAALTILAALTWPAVAGPQCKCRLYNQKLEIGTITCIRGKLAQCLMFQNTPSWKYLNQSCPVSENSRSPMDDHLPRRIATVLR